MRRIMSFLIIAALVLATAAPAAAADPDSADLEKAILMVKSVIDIPQDASIFDYHYWDDPSMGRVMYLTWNDKKYEKSYSVTINEDGVIANFHSYEQREPSSLGSMTREQGQRIAEEFLVRVLPDRMGDFRLKDSASNDMSFSYSFMGYMNGLPVSDLYLHLDVDKQAGKVTSYFANSFIREKDVFQEADEDIGADGAKAAFIDGKHVALVYRSNYDYERRGIDVFPAYTINSGHFVDAATGEAVIPYRDYYGVYGYNTAEAMDNGARSEGSNRLTPEEKIEVDRLTGMISRDEAVRSAVSKIPGAPPAAKPTSASLGSSYEERGKYFWQLHFDEFSATVNAVSGALEAFYFYGEPKGREKPVTLAAAERTASDFIKKVAADKAGKVVFSESRSSRDLPMPMPKGGEPEQRYYTFVYSRVVNGTEFPGNSILVSVDARNGMINRYALTWHDSVEFPEIDDAVSASGAFDVFAAGGAFGMMYMRSAESSLSLVYGFLDAPSYSVDPATGKKLGHDGKEHKERRAASDYDDISGKWYEETVKSLLDNGYYIEGESFNGGAEITQEEFLRYLYSPSQAYYSQDEFYAMLERGKILTGGEKAPDSVIKRRDAAKFAVRFLGLDMAARDGGIFVNPFSDAVQAEYAGYAALAKALGVMKGDSAGNFNGERNMTRGEAASVIYSVLYVK